MPASASDFNQFTGIVPPGSLNTSVIDFEGNMVLGMIIIPTPVNGTLASGSLQFSVGINNGTLYPLNDATNTRVSVSFGAAATAYTLAAVQGIAPYRYVRVSVNPAQGAGCRLVFPTKN